MKKQSLYYLSLVLIVFATLLGCSKKSNIINDGQVIETPYSLFFTDVYGALYNTNDGKIFKTMFTSDGTPGRSMVTDHTNILWARNDLFVSVNNGGSFNYSYSRPNLAAETFLNVYAKPCSLNQSMLINIPAWNQTYVASRETASGGNYFGMAGSVNGGLLNSWIQQNYYDTVELTDHGTPVYVTSFTDMKGDTLIAWSAITQVAMVRSSASARWTKVYTSPFPLDSSKAWYSIGHINHRLIIIDNKGTATMNGGSPAYYSDDKCITWTPCTGLPSNTPISCISSPWEQVCFVGTDGMGVYLLNPNVNAFQPSNVGLPAHLSVRNISFKQNIFKNGNKQQYVYLATDQGIFQSVDLGISWVKVFDGNFVTIY